MGASFLSNELDVPLTLRARCTAFSDCALHSLCARAALATSSH